jgi:hypothetical protein
VPPGKKYAATAHHGSATSIADKRVTEQQPGNPAAAGSKKAHSFHVTFRIPA